MPAFLERLLPGLLRKHTAGAFEILYKIASHQESLTPDLHPKSRQIWNMITGSSSGILHQLFIENADPYLDWGLKGQLHRLELQETLTLYYWMLLYWLSLLKHFGVSSCDPSYDLAGQFPKFLSMAHEFADSLAKRIGISTPPPFSNSWLDDPPLDSALHLVNATYSLLGLTAKQQDLGLRLLAVSRFSVAAEALYSVFVRRALTSPNDQDAHSP